ncbi:hypothetical protein [Eubacterium barkeri]|uniref:Uncharacterized protein n=1 Tax=Eubacterium barkeri TaxID=1528 RepID=A0A1H3FS05_EUBBA|nr:hypothetical protein [Eubacterium barkeri]SDX93587.1 hypothetical protein SAMN04488579_11160 [Eubacterium barkeri]
MTNSLKVHKHTLLLIGGIVWGFAGFNILRIGLLAYPPYVSIINILLTLLVYAAFQFMVFGKMVRKHTIRITQYAEDQQFFMKFFDVKAFCIMAFMIIFGVSLRYSGWVPEVFIAVFYTGLGASLATAGVLFIVNYVKECREARQNGGVK